MNERKVLWLNELEWMREGDRFLSRGIAWLPPIEERIRNAPDGRLKIEKANKSREYYLVVDGKKIYLPKTAMEEIRALAQKGYDVRAVRVLRRWDARRKKIRKWMEEETLADIYESLSPVRRELVTPLVGSAEEFVEAWLQDEYEGLGFRENEPEFYAKDGTRVRSKSERDAVDEMVDHNVPYKYEKPLELRGYGLVCPDFRVLNRRTGQEFIWEHFGMMDDRSYAQDNIRKLEAYHYNGYFEGINFLCTFETRRTPFGAKDARRVIEQYLL